MEIEAVAAIPKDGRKVMSEETQAVAQRIIAGEILKLTLSGRHSRNNAVRRIRWACFKLGVHITTRIEGDTVMYVQRVERA